MEILAGNGRNSDHVYQESLVIHGIFHGFCRNFPFYAAKAAFGAGAVEKRDKTNYNIIIAKNRIVLKIFKEAKKMTKIKSLCYSLAALSAVFLNAALFLCANTTSCAFIHQPEAPKALERFCRIK